MGQLFRDIAKNRYEYLWVLPGLALVLFLTFYAAVFSVRISLFDYRLSTTVRPFVGLGNYIDLLFHDKAYWGSLGRSFLFMAFDVPLPIAIGLVLALALNTNIRLRPAFRSVFLLPWILSMVAAGYMMQWIFNDVSGIANASIMLMGGQPLPWLSSPRLAFMTVIIADVWKTFPFSMVVLLAALQSIPDELYEAARIDGASGFAQLFRITIPLLRSHIMVLLILRSLRSFNMIDFIVVMTGGGPGTATQLLSFHMYQTAFTYFDLGRAAAMALTVLVMNIILTFAYMRFVGTESHY
jgi:multiple sugar transport system permease protein